jgi:starch synthase (maltosyl-transferring)
MIEEQVAPVQPSTFQLDGRSRVVIERVSPEIDCGRFAVKRVKGEVFVVEADVFADGHDDVAAELLYRTVPNNEWQRVPMQPLTNDRWRGQFQLAELGRHEYTVEGWIDRFATWRHAMAKRLPHAPEFHVECLIGAGLIDDVASRADAVDAARLRKWARSLRDEHDPERAQEIALDDELYLAAQRYPDRRFAARYDKTLNLHVDRERAGFSTWYEIFPRSCTTDGHHGTLRDCIERLPYIASMGFDVLYLPPVHPIGHTFRKGRNNTLPAEAGDPGSPWAIGSSEGGHTAVHPDLGTLDDFDRLIAAGRQYGIEVALDLAYQCSPDHPYAFSHPEWFKIRPDGTIQYAENPPKKYQDIIPLDFESPGWRELWEELKRVVLFWVDRGVRIFRCDNPHTKAFSFWEWLIGEVQALHPDVLFLAEAFTRPKVMYRLAKAGFTQSYSYFTWRNSKEELTAYFRELNDTAVSEFCRPNLWPNTPDILPEFLQVGGRAAFMARLLLASTLSSNYGVFGPEFEMCENRPIEPGTEEYLNSSKYEIKRWDIGGSHGIQDLIARLNRIRRESPALQRNRNLHFHETDNPSVICYSKATNDRSDVIIVVVNLDVFHTQSGWVKLDMAALGLDSSGTFQAHDLLGESRYLWQGSRNYFELVPETKPGHVMKVRRWVRTERDFDYYL